MPDEAHGRSARQPDRVTSTAPPETRPAPAPVVEATAQATAAARRAGVRLLGLDTLAGVREAAALFGQVWRTDAASPPLAVDVMRAVEHSGGYVIGAYRDRQLVGASSGFLGLDGGAPMLHSHISGVSEPGRGIGLALKLHQRAWALRRGIDAITWTFDPLVRRNAWFNLAKLGATGVEYLVDFYGPMSGGVNGGESSDRLFTRWNLTAAAAGTAAGGDAQVVLDERDGLPYLPRATTPDGSALLVRLPADIEALRSMSPPAARAWRIAVRDILVPAFADGYTVRGITSDGCLLLAP